MTRQQCQAVVGPKVSEVKTRSQSDVDKRVDDDRAKHGNEDPEVM